MPSCLILEARITALRLTAADGCVALLVQTSGWVKIRTCLLEGMDSYLAATTGLVFLNEQLMMTSLSTCSSAAAAGRSGLLGGTSSAHSAADV